MVILDFDTTGIEPFNAFEPLPVGEYKVILQSAEGPIETVSGTGSYLKLRFQVIEGEYKNRVLFENLNLWRTGQSEKDKTTIRIAQSKLRDLCLAVGKAKIRDTSELLNKPLIVHLKIRDGGNYGPQNEITAYKPINGGTTLDDVPATEPSAVVTTSKMPWE